MDTQQQSLRDDRERVEECLEKHCTGGAECPVPHASWDRIAARLTVLADAVREYVTDRSHMPYCGAAYGRGDPCHCGLDKLAAALVAERA